jgi:adenylylsulfate kinase-like enzyme
MLGADAAGAVVNHVMVAGGAVVWLTGLPSAGKTTIANLVGKRLTERGRPVEVLDGDVIRNHPSRGLGFSKADWYEDIRHIGYVAGLLTGHGVTVVVSDITARALPPSRAGPYRRRRSSSMIHQTASEVFLTVRGRT